MQKSADNVNFNDYDLVSLFDVSTCSSESVYDIFENEDKIITEDSNVGVNTNKFFGKGGSLKFLIVNCHRIPII